jgi:hypothetical protein
MDTSTPNSSKTRKSEPSTKGLEKQIEKILWSYRKNPTYSRIKATKDVLNLFSQSQHDNEILVNTILQEKAKQIGHAFNEGYRSRDAEAPKHYQKGRSDLVKEIEGSQEGE